MIRNGRARRIWAEAERARLSAVWQAYPEAVRHCLNALLRNHGIEAAQLATEAVEQSVNQQHASQEKEERDDAPTS